MIWITDSHFEMKGSEGEELKARLKDLWGNKQCLLKYILYSYLSKKYEGTIYHTIKFIGIKFNKEYIVLLQIWCHYHIAWNKFIHKIKSYFISVSTKTI